MNSTIFRQYEGAWAKKAYPGKGYTVSGAGCGLVALTHIAIEQESKKKWTPENLRTHMINKGYVTYGNGTKWDGITQTLKYIGHKKVVYITESIPMKDAFTELDKGNRIGIILFYGGYSKSKKKWYRTPDGTVWTTSGHYIAFNDYKVENGLHKFKLKDSGGRKHDGWYSYEKSMKGCVGQLWIVERIDAPTPSPKAYTGDGKLTVDGSGGVATVKRLQEFLGISQTGGITIKKSLHKYVPALTATEYADTGSATVKYLQKWLGITQDGHWGKGTSKALQKKLGVKEDGVFGPDSMKTLQEYLNSNDKAVYPKKTNSQKLVDRAEALAWPKATAAAKYAYKGGAPTAAFKSALNMVFPNRSSWGAAPKVGAACDVYMATVLNSSGIGVTNCPRGLDQQMFFKHEKLERLVYRNVTPYSVSRDGDIVMYYKNKKGTSKHVVIRGNGVIYEAQLKLTYGHVNTAVKSKLNVKRPYVVILRAR